VAGARERFPGYDVVSQSGHWDPVTAGVVLARLAPPPALRFFDPREEAVGTALVDLLLAQHRVDGPAGRRYVPVFAMIDSRLAEGDTDGWHYADMPEDGDAWRASLAHLDHDANARYGRGFAECSPPEQEALVRAVNDLGAGTWHDLPAKQVWSLWTRYACTAYYAHPWSWDEIGFGGPAYPRGYKNRGVGRREPYEVPDHHPDVDPVRGS
jgi:hypothetical protein